jgi:hypothetical protein
MINFSNTCGIGLNGARIIKTAITIRIEYGILSRMAHMGTYPKEVTKADILLIFQLNQYLSRK